jgi:hypothetical protein
MPPMSQHAPPALPEGRRVNYRSIALPIEHGGWGFTLEPVLLGLLVAYSAAAWELSVAALAVFLARRPLKLVATDIVRRRWLPRSTVALGFTSLYGVVALTGLLGALVTAGSRFVIAYAVAIPFALIALYADSQSKSRTLVAELAGATAMGSTATAIALADGWGAMDAFGLWLVLIARGIATISLVRGQIRRVHGKPVGERGIYTVTLATLAGIAVAAAVGAAPWLSVVAILGIAALAYVSLRRPPVAAKTVGWTQVATGLAVVLLTAFGVWADI